MKYLVLTLVFAAGFAAAHLTGSIGAADPQPPVAPSTPMQPNPNIDMDGHIKNVIAAAKNRETHRLSESDFIKASQEDGVIVLDARSKEMYDLLHVKGAINLSFPDIDIETLKKVLPDKKAKILIYCNNNFAPEKGTVPATAFKSKAPIASLNISTFAALHGYGYTNVYELAPTLDPAKTKLELVSTKK